MKYMGVKLDKNKLMTQAYVTEYLQDANYSVLQELRDIYEWTFGLDFVWNYQCCGDFFPGFYLMPVHEGFLAIPYNEVEADECEQIVAEGIELLSAAELQFRLERWEAYAKGLRSAMKEMIAITKKGGKRRCNWLTYRSKKTSC